MKQYSKELELEEQYAENPIASNTNTTKRYDFARCFTPNPSSSTNLTTTITILEGTRALYHLFDFPSIRKSSKSSRSQSTILLKSAQHHQSSAGTTQTQTQTRKKEEEPLLVIFHPRVFRSDVIKIRATNLHGGDSKKRVKISLRGFLKSWEIRDVGSIIEVAVAQPNLLGLPDGASLLWRLASDHEPTTMTLYSAGSWGTSKWSTVLAQAFFSQSAAASHSVKLIALETIEEITEPLLIYILISASIIESKLLKQHRATGKRQSLGKVKITQWTTTPFGIQPSCAM